MPSTTVPAYAYWAGHSYYPSLLDPLGTADLLLLGILPIVLLTLILGFRFWVFRRKQAKLQRWHGHMVRKLDEFKQARREGRQDELDDLTFSANDIHEAEAELKRGHHQGVFFALGFSVLALLLSLCLALIATSWAHWWLEGGYKCATTDQPVYNQLDPDGHQQTTFGGRVNLCAPGLFTHPWLFVSHPKEAIRETLY
ncbi:hypothetical protein HT749_15540 [Burkholderia cepacia]|uniref:hypothetical protein n=1 Tax=Burkholderia cepacia TaxID=292 RepID=UPI00157A7CE5|nr:hypothetical protein [Burkholderia cepacia]NTX44819.1 hypothetical protein [Burkholderia cepacia]